MTAEIIPIMVVPAVPCKEGIRFLHFKEQIDVSLDSTNKLWEILAQCNGRNTVQVIAKQVSKNVDDVKAIILELMELGVVMDSREQFLYLHKITNYPTPFNYNLTQDEIILHGKSPRKEVKVGNRSIKCELSHRSPLSSIIEKRCSCRNFSDTEMTAEEIGDICYVAYSIANRSVPSGGALYPLKLYVLVERHQKGIFEGYYEYDAEQNCLVEFSDEVDEEQLKYCFNQETLPFGSSVQIIIAADFRRQSYKYANRAYRLALLEAGHVAENISLYCTEHDFLGSCELGGILDDPLKAELKLDDNIYPLLAIAIGHPEYHESKDEAIDKVRFAEANIGVDKIVKDIAVKTFGKDGSFFGVTAEYHDNGSDPQYAGATSTSYMDARFKAVAESYERLACSVDKSICFGSAEDLRQDNRLLSPYSIYPLTQKQARQCGVAFFEPSLPIGWTIGKDVYDNEILVPSDIVYYGHFSRGNQIYFGNSSGVAAHTDFGEAKKRAILELVERDAIMRNWYSRKPPEIIGERYLPIHAERRIEHWAKQGRKVSVLELPSKYGWVFEVIIVSEKYPFFVSGAAATIDEWEISETIHKALQEAEYNLLLNINYSDESEIDPRSVATPADHGRLYRLEKYAKTLSWLWSGDKDSIYGDSPKRSIRQLAAELDAITVDLSDDKLGELKVVRVLSPRLVPINFGFYSAHYTHPELKDKIHPKSLEMPHYFA